MHQSLIYASFISLLVWWRQIRASIASEAAKNKKMVHCLLSRGDAREPVRYWPKSSLFNFRHLVYTHLASSALFVVAGRYGAYMRHWIGGCELTAENRGWAGVNSAWWMSSSCHLMPAGSEFSGLGWVNAIWAGVEYEEQDWGEEEITVDDVSANARFEWCADWKLAYLGIPGNVVVEYTYMTCNLMSTFFTFKPRNSWNLS